MTISASTSRPERIGETYGEIKLRKPSYRPTLNIAKAARAAIVSLQKARKPGRKHNRVDQVLADGLGDIFRRSGQPIRRGREPIMRRDEAVFVEGGPVYDFLELVLKPLRAYLRQQQLAPVTTETIVRLITDDFPRVS